MKIEPYNYRYKSLVNLLIGVAGGLLLRASGLPPRAGWILVIVLTAVLYLLLNYRPSTGRTKEPRGSGMNGER